MGDRPRPSEQDLQDYLDGRLDPACQAEIATYLADHPETAARVERYRAQVAGLHALYDGILSEPIPAGIRAALQQAAARRRRPRLAVAAAAAVAALVMAGVVALRWGGSDVAELGDETVARVLSERLGAAVILPEAARAGFTLTAVHLLPPPHRAALLLYRDAANHIASLYITAGAQEDERGGDAAAGGVHTFFRNARGVFYALSVSNAEPDETLRRAFAMGP
jgi:anti-sigma factor RsiW